ncbi:MAG: hypothetical protein J6C23_01920 [Clostridia bacterium]|nr:hypothetical protein [Clostridia bacterium]
MKTRALHIIDKVINILAFSSLFIPILEVHAIAFLVQMVLTVIVLCCCVIIRNRILDETGETDICKLVKINNAIIKRLLLKIIFLLLNGTMFIVLADNWMKNLCFFPYSMSVLTAMVVFAQLRLVHVFPLNSFKDYLLKINDFFNDNNLNDIKIRIVETNDGVWETECNGKHVIFDLRECIFPKSVITSYLSRQLRYKQINQQKLPLKSLWKRNLELNYLSNDYKKVEVCFKDKNGKVCQKTIVEKSISKLSYIESKIIIDTVYSKCVMQAQYVLPKIKKGKYKFLNERIFLEFSDVNLKKPSFTEKHSEHPDNIKNKT